MSDLKAAPARAADQLASTPETDPHEAPQTVEAPPVVAVVVASNPGEHFAEMLASLGDQDYENLSVLVIDAGSDEPIADRVADVLPGAYLHRLAGDPGWSVAANQSIELVSGSPFLLFCHDDVALDERCVSTLMRQLYRNNAGIAGPKMVRWDDRRRLLQLGMGADRFGVLVEQVERGEFDQQQYDSVRDVFVAPGGVQLIRADLFVTLGGFDPEIGLMGEDLDLCWRAHAVGARVLAVSDAMARHRESMDERLTARERRKLITRHRLRTVMVTATGRGRGRLLTVPLAMLLIMLEGVYYLLTGRRGPARDMFEAIGWNLARTADIRRRRRALRQMRQRSEREVRSLQIGGSAALNTFSRGQFTAGQDRMSGLLGAIRSSFQGEDSGTLRDATITAFGLITVILFGSRHLLTRPVAAVGQLPIVPGFGALVDEWLGGWRSAGTGGAGNPPTGLLVLALGRLLTFWSPWLFDQLLLVGPIVFGAVGAFRLTRPLGSARAAGLSSILYAASPLLTTMYSAGRWESLVVYAAAPYLAGSLFRLNAAAPYGPRFGRAAPRVSRRGLPVLVIRYGFLVAAVAAFAPAVVVVGIVMAISVLLATPLTDRELRWREFGLATVVAVAAPVALHFPWSYDVMQSFSWRWLVGSRSPELAADGMIDLIILAPGVDSPRYLGLGLVVVALLGLAMAPARSFRFAVQGWTLALVPMVLVWMDIRGWMPVALPAAEIMLSPALVGLCVAATLAVRGVEESHGLPRNLPRRLGHLGIGLGVAVASVQGILGSLSGNWGLPSSSFVIFTSVLEERAEDSGRILWIGDPGVLPLDAVVSDSGVPFALSDGGTPEIWGRWSSGPVGSTGGIGYHLDLARAGETVRLGRLLAPYGIDYIAVATQLAPPPYEGPEVSPGVGVIDALNQQLDLERAPGSLNLIVFRNAAAGGTATVLTTQEAAEALTTTDQLTVDNTGGEDIDVETLSSGRWRIQAPGGNPLRLAVPAEGLEINGRDGVATPGFDGLAVIPATETGELDITYPTPLGRRAGQLVQVVVVGAGVILAQTRREANLEEEIR